MVSFCSPSAGSIKQMPLSFSSFSIAHCCCSFFSAALWHVNPNLWPQQLRSGSESSNYAPCLRQDIHDFSAEMIQTSSCGLMRFHDTCTLRFGNRVEFSEIVTSFWSWTWKCTWWCTWRVLRWRCRGQQGTKFSVLHEIVFPSEMHFGDLKPRVIHHTIERKRSFSKASWLKRGVGVAELCGSRIPPLPGNYAKFFEKTDEDGLLEQVGLRKRFRKSQKVFRASRGSPESRLRTSLGLGIVKGWLGTQEAPDAPCQDRKILPHQTRKKDSSLFAWTIHQFSIVWLCLFLRNKFFAILQFLSNLLHDWASSQWWTWHSSNLWDSSSRLVSQRATSELIFSHFLVSMSASASDNRLWTAHSSRTAKSAFCSKWHANLSFQTKSAHFQDLDLFSLLNAFLQHWEWLTVSCCEITSGRRQVKDSLHLLGRIVLAAACLWKQSEFSLTATVVVTLSSKLKQFCWSNWSECAHCWRRYRCWAHDLWEGRSRPDSQTVPPAELRSPKAWNVLSEVAEAVQIKTKWMTQDEDREDWEDTSWMKMCVDAQWREPLQTSQVQLTCADLSHACARDQKVLRRARARHNKTEKRVRATRCSVFISRRQHASIEKHSHTIGNGTLRTTKNFLFLPVSKMCRHRIEKTFCMSYVLWEERSWAAITDSWWCSEKQTPQQQQVRAWWSAAAPRNFHSLRTILECAHGDA